MLSSYVVDGFATAGNVCGARLVGEAAGKRIKKRARRANANANENERFDERFDDRSDDEPTSDDETPVCVCRDELRWTCVRVLAFGLTAGLAFLAVFFLFESQLVALFTADEEVASFLRARGVWRTLALAQPLNALVFVYDGLVYAFQDFAYARELMSTGVGYVFLPSLAFVAASARPTTLADIWRCKVALNAWRLALLAARTHGWSLTKRGFACLVRENQNQNRRGRGAEAAQRAPRQAAARGGGDGGGEPDDVAWTAAPAPAARDGADAIGAESPTSHWRQLGSAAREDGDASGDDVEAPLLSRGSPRGH